MKIKILTLILVLGTGLHLYAQKVSAPLLSGFYESPYGSFMVGLNNGVVSGSFLYLDQYDQETRVYMRQEYFNFYGRSSDGYNYEAIALSVLDHESPFKCYADFTVDGKKLRIQLERAPWSGVEFDFSQTSTNNFFAKVLYLPILEVGMIKPKKAILYNYDGKNYTARKGYLVIGDVVGLLSTSGSYSKIFYKNPENGKSNQYYVLTTDLYLGDPVKWFKK